jgi:hypothetical protein
MMDMNTDTFRAVLADFQTHPFGEDAGDKIGGTLEYMEPGRADENPEEIARHCR